MKQCNACKKEISVEASKCPQCQSYQLWYKNPQIYGLFLVVPLFVFWILYVSWGLKSLKSKNYAEYKAQFTIEKVSQLVSDNKKSVSMTYKIRNSTKYKWENPKYQVIGTDEKGAVIYTCSSSEYSWEVQPDSEAFLTVDCWKNKAIANWSVKIVDMQSSQH